MDHGLEAVIGSLLGQLCEALCLGERVAGIGQNGPLGERHHSTVHRYQKSIADRPRSRSGRARGHEKDQQSAVTD